MDQIRQAVAERLNELDGVVALRKSSEGVAPFVFQKGDDLAGLEITPKYPVMTLVSKLHKRFPKSGWVCGAGCDERAYIEMAKRNQIDPDRLYIIGFCLHGRRRANLPLPGTLPKQLLWVPAPTGIGQSTRCQVRRNAACRAARVLEAAVRQVHLIYGCRNICPNASAKRAPWKMKPGSSPAAGRSSLPFT